MELLPQGEGMLGEETGRGRWLNARVRSNSSIMFIKCPFLPVHSDYGASKEPLIHY